VAYSLQTYILYTLVMPPTRASYPVYLIFVAFFVLNSQAAFSSHQLLPLP
jgi:hypothetical protein